MRGVGTRRDTVGSGYPAIKGADSINVVSVGQLANQGLMICCGNGQFSTEQDCWGGVS